MSESVVGYLRECYREDFARGGVRDIFADSIRHRIFVDGEEYLASGFLEKIYLPPKRGTEAELEAKAYKRERELVYVSLFLVGFGRFAGEVVERFVCAPVVMYPAQLEVEEGAKGNDVSVSVLLSGRRLNGAVFEALGTEGMEFADRIDEELGDAELSEGDVLRLCAELKKLDADIDDSKMAVYPQLINGKEFRRICEEVRESYPDGWMLLPASCVCLKQQSRGARGVLEELGEMVAEAEKGGAFSAPLTALLEGHPEGSAALPDDVNAPHVPAVLSLAQEQVLKSARVNPLTLAIGPPGTGKSFTIAALALDHVARGKSVLVSSRNDHAVDVVGEKMRELAGHDVGVTRAGRGAYLKELKQYLQDLLSGMFTGESPDSLDDKIKKLQLQRQAEDLRDLENRLLKDCRRLRDAGRYFRSTETGIFAKLKRWWVGKSVAGSPLLASVFEQLEEILEARIQSARVALRTGRQHWLKRVLATDRTLFQRLDKAIRGRTAASQEKYLREFDFDKMFAALPVWLVNLSDAHHALPLKKELFDLVIIDEASHCDIASALPVLQRGKRAVIAGDPKQLRHISFLSDQRQRKLLEQFAIPQDRRDEVNYRQRSLLDLVMDRIGDQSRVGFLNEHFRSRPSIIRFSNQAFYAGRLHVMTEASKAGSEEPCGGLQLHSVNGKMEDGVNRKEARDLVKHLAKVISDQKDWPDDSVVSLGVLSPFRKQTDYLRKEFEKQRGADFLRRAYEHHQLIFDTPHGFQGEERDVMFLSLAVDGDSNRMTLRYLEKPDVFNVSVTRARLEQHVFHSVALDELAADSLLAGYLAHRPEGGVSKGERRGEDGFAREVMAALSERGYSIVEGHRVAGLDIDLLATGVGCAAGIDLIGYPGRFHDVFSLERYRMFSRAGLRILPLGFVEWKLRREECLKKIGEVLKG